MLDLSLTCVSCNHSAGTTFHDLEQKVGERVHLANVNQLYHRLHCAACGATDVLVSDASGRTLVDPRNLVECRKCSYPIEHPRLQTNPNTNVCASCAKQGAKPNLNQTHLPEVITLDRDRIPKDLRNCPDCGKNTVLRQNRRTLERFIGCSGFPYCRWTMSEIK